MKTKNTKKTKSEIGLQTSPVELLERKPETEAVPAVAQPPTAAQVAEPAQRILPFVNYAERDNSRNLSTDEVLAHLRRWYPETLALAQVVGAWIWVTFPEPPAETLRAGLFQIGFHWNNYRKCWQHPCGKFETHRSGRDPRQTYGTRVAA